MSHQTNITAACKIIRHRTTTPESFQPAAEYWLLRQGHNLFTAREVEEDGSERFKVAVQGTIKFGTGPTLAAALASLIIQVHVQVSE